jgi:hypothetical protein
LAELVNLSQYTRKKFGDRGWMGGLREFYFSPRGVMRPERVRSEVRTAIMFFEFIFTFSYEVLISSEYASTALLFPDSDA